MISYIQYIISTVFQAGYLFCVWLEKHAHYVVLFYATGNLCILHLLKVGCLVELCLVSTSIFAIWWTALKIALFLYSPSLRRSNASKSTISDKSPNPTYLWCPGNSDFGQTREHLPVKSFHEAWTNSCGTLPQRWPDAGGYNIGNF